MSRRSIKLTMVMAMQQLYGEYNPQLPPQALAGKRTTGTNIKLFDRFTFAHIAIGVWFGSMGMGLIPSVFWHGLFELFENKWLKGRAGALFPDSTVDTKMNMTGDMLAMIFGWMFNLKDAIDDPVKGNLFPFPGGQ